jgi:hypothetical protein
VNIDRFDYANQAYSSLNSLLETVFMKVMPSDFLRPWFFGQPFCRKYILPKSISFTRNLRHSINLKPHP